MLEWSCQVSELLENKEPITVSPGLTQPLSGPCARTSGWNLKNSEDPPEGLIPFIELRPALCEALGDPFALSE